MSKGPSGGVRIVSSTVTTGGGDIVGGDKVQYISRNQIDDIFSPIEKAMEGATPDLKAKADEKLRAMKNEIGKGKGANDFVLAKLVEGLIGLVPGAVAAVVGAFASPLLSGIAGPATKYVLDKIAGK